MGCLSGAAREVIEFYRASERRWRNEIPGAGPHVELSKIRVVDKGRWSPWFLLLLLARVN